MALVLAAALSVVGYCRVIAFTANTSSTEALAVAASLFLIVALSIVLGAALPIFLEKINAGASNAATTIQVVMDVGRAHHVRGVRPPVGWDVAFVGAAAGGRGVRCGVYLVFWSVASLGVGRYFRIFLVSYSR